MSMISSVGGIQAELAVRLNEVSADEADVYLTWINLTSQDINNSLINPRYLEASSYATLSSGTRIYSLPTDFGAMYSVRIPSHNIKLGYIPPEQFDALQPSATDGGIPTRYTIFQEGIEFYPQPNSSLDVYYKYNKTFLNLSAASASLPVPYNFVELYVNKGVAYGLERRGDYTNASVFHKRYETLLDKMNADIKSIESKRMKSVREFSAASHSGDPIVNNIWS